MSLDKEPKVAVIMSAYNVENYIDKAIESVAKDKYSNKTLFIYNDGSTDKTSNVIKETLFKCEKLNSVYIPCENNIGLSKGRNVLIKSAWNYADYFLILDGDDQFIGEDKITKMISVAESQSDLIGVVYCDYQNWHEKDGKIVREYKRGFSRSELINECILSDSGTLVSKKAYEKVGFYDESLKVGMDYDMWLRISEHYLIYHIPECLTQVTIRSGSLSSDPKNSEVWKNNVRRVYEKLFERTSR